MAAEVAEAEAAVEVAEAAVEVAAGAAVPQPERARELARWRSSQSRWLSRSRSRSVRASA